MKIQQHDGVVVDAAVTAAGLRRSSARGRGVAGEEGGAQGCRLLPSLPPLYIGPLGRGAGQNPSRVGGAAAKGVACLPSQGGRPHP